MFWRYGKNYEKNTFTYLSCSSDENSCQKNVQKSNLFRTGLIMPVYIDSPGYDKLQYWTRMELRRLYQAEGYSTKEAAKILNISPRTAETHRASIMKKLDAKNVADIVKYCIRNHIIEA